MRKQTLLALFIVVAAFAIPTVPAHAGFGGLLKAAAKAGTVADDAARGAAKAGTHVDDAALSATRHADDATVGAVVVDGAAADAQHARAAKGADEASEGSLAKDVAEQAIGVAVDAAGDDDGAEHHPVIAERALHARRLATLAELEAVGRTTKDDVLLAKVARIRAKERARHESALATIEAMIKATVVVTKRAPGKP